PPVSGGPAARRRPAPRRTGRQGPRADRRARPGLARPAAADAAAPDAAVLRLPARPGADAGRRELPVRRQGRRGPGVVGGVRLGGRPDGRPRPDPAALSEVGGVAVVARTGRAGG